MKNNLLQLKLIPPVVAFLLSLFLIFPDIIWRYAHSSSEQFPKVERHEARGFREFKPPFEHEEGRPPMQMPQKPNQFPEPFPRMGQIENAGRMLQEFISFFIIAYILMLMDVSLFKKELLFRSRSSRMYVHVLGINVLICTFAAFIHLLFIRGGGIWPPDGMMIFKCYFIGLTAYLVVYLLMLVVRQQTILVENEQLKTQNLEVQYTSLATQLNPHFFFNSMNSLSFLIRGKEQEKSLKYLQKLSEMFRYLLSSDKRNVATLKEELDMLQAYCYMMEIRYEDKLLFDVQVDEQYYNCRLPVLTLQPLIENAIKHNEISEDNPLAICISMTEGGGYLEVSNPIQPKFLKEESTGIGLANLNERYKLLFGTEILVSSDGKAFCVRVPVFLA